MPALNPNGLYCAYLRKSRRDEELELLGHGETLARHEAQLSALAQRLGIRVAQTYREIVSGDTIAERPQVRRLLDDVSAGRWDGVLVMDVDRLGRGDSIDQGVIMQTFLYSSTLILTPDKIYDPADEADGEFFEIKLFFSRREYTMIKKRMQRGRVAAALAGCYSSPRAPFGYERVKLPDRKGWSLRPVPEKADLVRMMFAWYADGIDGQTVGTHTIADRLIRMGVRTDLGHNFTPSSIRQILRNPVYIGKIRWNTRVTVHRMEEGRRVRSRPRGDQPILVDGLHDPIVDRDLFDRVQAIFDDHGKFPLNPDAHVTNPLAGLLVCGECGHLMQAKGDPKRRGDFLYCPTQRCPTCSAYLAVVEALILQVLRGWVSEFEHDPSVPSRLERDRRAADDAAQRQLTAQIDTLSAQQSRLFDLLETGVYDADTFRARRADLDSRLAQARAELDALRSAPPPPPMAALAPRIRTVLAAYDVASPDRRNALLRQVVRRVIYHKPRRCFRNDDVAAHITLDVLPRYPVDDE